MASYAAFLQPFCDSSHWCLADIGAASEASKRANQQAENQHSSHYEGNQGHPASQIAQGLQAVIDNSNGLRVARCVGLILDSSQDTRSNGKNHGGNDKRDSSRPQG